MTVSGPVLLIGMVIGLGVFLIGRGCYRATAKLSDALATLDAGEASGTRPPPEVTTRGLEGAGWWLHRKLRLPVRARQQQLLSMQQRSIGDFFAERLVWASAGFLLPILWLVLQTVIGGEVSALPLVASAAGVLGGFFLADLRLASSASTVQRSTTESLHTFFDLVALERLANQSAVQSVSSAAEISDAPLFQRISSGLERAQLEQRPPWAELKHISVQWRMPELADFADVMQLEAQGAPLADALQARVRELRDAHLSEQKAAAQQATEGLSLWMTIPALLLGVAFVIPPLLTLTGS